MINLNIFNTKNLFEAGLELFSQLGITLNSNTSISLNLCEILKEHYKDREIFKNVTETYYLGLIDDSVFDNNLSPFGDSKLTYDEASNKITEGYNGIMVFGVNLLDSYLPKRSAIADITRAFNCASKNIPIILLLQYGNLLSFATSERTKYQQQWREGEKIGKVSLLKDINIVSPHTGHLKILDDLKIKPEVVSFNVLYQQWREVFDIQLLNKKFYQELANWYFWAMDNVHFPDDVEKKEDIRNATNLIRLITRIVFIWFIKEKDLVTKILFDKNRLNRILKDFNKNKESHTYYHAILQNLFFGTLNQKMQERSFVKEGTFADNKSKYGVKNLFRYADKFVIKENEALELFKDIPFLNGGLFDCLDKEDDSGKVVYVDGFSRNPKKQAIIPDFLFFVDEQEVDLNKTFGTRNKKYKVKGLINILESYKFTITENTPIEEEIALDPELLGKVFENLLASYNPETAATARKATGSYYTPREIVDYMVETSLLEYFKESTVSILADGVTRSRDAGGTLEERLKSLLSYSEEIPVFSEEEKQKIISAIDEIKILDPACGSGAFPMGVLHKLVHILQRLDPENKYWYELQYQKALKESEKVFKQGDDNQREERLKEINEAFDEGINYPDYARKLYLIENCIYGVDIQPIAIQISKLRFFISLVLDQKVDKSKENFGIRALPNLETRFVAANTLIGLEIPQEDLLLQNTEVKQIQDELAKERHKYFNAKTRSEKIYYQGQDKILREKLAEKVKDFLTDKKQDEINQIKKSIKEEELKLQKVIQEPEDIEIIEQATLFGEVEQIKFDKKKEKIKQIRCSIKKFEKEQRSIQKQIEGDFVIKIAKKIASFDLYNQNASADFFDPEWMFGVTEGFDIVIANPPYGADMGGQTLQKIVETYSYYDRQKNSASFFIELASRLVKKNAIVTYIVPKSLSFSEGWQKTRRLITEINTLHIVADVSKSFENVLLEAIIISFLKRETQTYSFKAAEGWNNEIILTGYPTNELIKELDILPVYMTPARLNILRKISLSSVPLSAISQTFRGLPLQNKVSKNGDYILRGKNIGRFKIYGEIDKILLPEDYLQKKKVKYIMQKKIVSQNIVAHVLNPYDRIIIMASLDKEGLLTLDTVMNTIMTSRDYAYEYILALLNSRLASWFYYWFVYNRAVRTMHFDKYYIGKLPIKNISLSDQQSFITLVSQILAVKQHTTQSPLNRGENPNADTSALEHQIDQMVYQLYSLTDEEIKIVEGNNS